MVGSNPIGGGLLNYFTFRIPSKTRMVGSNPTGDDVHEEIIFYFFKSISLLNQGSATCFTTSHKSVWPNG